MNNFLGMKIFVGILYGRGCHRQIGLFWAILECVFKVNALNGTIWEGMLNFQTFLGYA